MFVEVILACVGIGNTNRLPSTTPSNNNADIIYSSHKLNTTSDFHILLLFLFLSNYILNISFIASHHIKNDTGMTVGFLSIGFTVAVLFLVGSLSNPGSLKNQKTSNYF